MNFNIIQRTYCYSKDSFLFFLYDPLPRVHAVLKKKDYPCSGILEKLPALSMNFPK